MTTVLSSPVPKKLQEIFHDHPELIQEIQDGLDRLAANPKKGTPIFEQAVWLLEDSLSEFVARAREELNRAEASGSAEDIQKAQAKLASMIKAKPKQVWLIGLDEFERYASGHGIGGAA